MTSLTEHAMAPHSDPLRRDPNPISHIFYLAVGATAPQSHIPNSSALHKSTCE